MIDKTNISERERKTLSHSLIDISAKRTDGSIYGKIKSNAC